MRTVCHMVTKLSVRFCFLVFVHSSREKWREMQISHRFSCFWIASLFPFSHWNKTWTFGSFYVWKTKQKYLALNYLFIFYQLYSIIKYKCDFIDEISHILRWNQKRLWGRRLCFRQAKRKGEFCWFVKDNQFLAVVKRIAWRTLSGLRYTEEGEI